MSKKARKGKKGKRAKKQNQINSNLPKEQQVKKIEQPVEEAKQEVIKESKEQKTKKQERNETTALILTRLKTRMVKKRILSAISILAVVVFVFCIGFLAYYYISKEQDRNKITEVQNITPVTEDKVNQETNTITETMQKVIELQNENSDVKGWITIDNTIIDYPVLQGTDNEYYLKHDYKKQYNKYGSIYIKPGFDINDVNSNLIIYGHNMKDELMFNSLLKYTDKKYYEEHKTIKITTNNEEREYEIVAAFKSRVFYQSEQNVFRYYNYLNFENEQKYTEYVNNVNRAKLYDTGVTAKFGEQLITLITCEYSQENGRMVVVAKRIK